MKKLTLLLLCTLFFNTFTRNDIFEDVRTKNKEALKQRLQNCENCAVKDENGNNALHIAAEDGDKEIIDILTTVPSYESWSDWLYACLYAPTLPDINEQNNDGDSPLLCTVYRGNTQSAEYLIEKGAHMEVVNNKGLSAPFLAVLKDDPRFIKIFTAHQLNLARHTRNGDTIFHAAIKEKKPKSIDYCVKETTLHNVANNEGKTPTFLVIDQNSDLLRIFKQSQLNAATSTGIKPIHYATEHNKYDAINYLLTNNISIDEPDTDGNPPIFYANDETMLNFLLARNADLQKRNHQGKDILAVVTHNKNIALMKVLTQKYNVDIDTRDNKGQTSFMRAAIEQNYEAMKLLIDSGVNIRITDNARETVLHKIARNGDQRAAKIALEHEKALLTDVDKDGNSPLFTAVQNGQMTFADFLIDAGSRIDTRNNDGDTILHELVKKNNNWLLTKLLKKVNANTINHQNKNGISPLLLAAAADELDTVKSLLMYQANSYVIDRYGNNIVHIAAGNGGSKVLQFLQHRKDLLNAQNHNGETPFEYAIKQGQLDAVKLLLTEQHFINGDIPNLITLMKNSYIPYDQHVYNFLLQQHNTRVLECQSIVGMARTTSDLVRDNNNLSKTLSEKTSRPYHPDTSLHSYHSENDLYKMTQTERNRVKNIYLERQNRELVTKSTLEQKLATIRAEEERKEKESSFAKASEDRLNKKTEAERIAARQGTTVAAQKAELERIAAAKYAADIAKHQERTATEKARVQAEENARAAQARVGEEPSFAKASEDRQEHSPVVPVVAQEAILEEGDCCISDDICTGEHGVKRMPCIHCHKGSARICQACLDKWIAKNKAQNKPTPCPTCNKPLTQ